MVRITLGLIIVLAVLASLPADAVTTAFTYQGKLTDSTGNPLTGSYDLTFKLYDAANAGAQVGSTVSLPGVSVSGGLLTAKLDFGSAPFTGGAARWLEIAVGPTILAPRVEITPSPSALFSAAPWVASGSTVSYAGNVGIGTSSPAAKLDVAGTAKMTGFQLGTSATLGHVLTASASGVGTWQTLPGSLPPSGAAGGDLIGTYPDPELATNADLLAKVSGGAMRSAAGGISIGTNVVPNGPFQVYGPTYTVDVEQLAGGGSTWYAGTLWQSFTAGATGTLTAVEIGMGSQDGLPWSGTLRVYSGEGTGGSVLASQTVSGGAQTTRVFPLETPAAISVGTQYTFGITPSGGATLRWLVQNSDVYAGGRFTSASWDAYFRTYLADRDSLPALVIQPGTLNVGVQNPSPGFPLSFPNVLGDKISLWGQSGGHYGLGIQSNLLQIYSSGSSADIAFGYGESASMTETVRIKGSGNVGIGTSTPSFKLHINGTVGIVSLPQADKRNVQWDPTTGQLYQAISSSRYKENITQLADDFEKLLSAEPKSYTQVNSPGDKEIGYIAEQIDELGLKNLVHYGADGKPEALKYEKMVLYLVEIAKTQRAENEDQQKQIDELKALVAALAAGNK